MAKQIQITKRQIPIEQILAIQGRSPVATGIETTGNVLGQALARKAELQRQGQQLAALSKLSGQEVPPELLTSGLNPEQLNQALSMRSASESRASQAAKDRVALELQLEKLRTGTVEIDPLTGKRTEIPGVQGLSLVYDKAGNPSVSRSVPDEPYKPGLNVKNPNTPRGTLPTLKGVTGDGRAVSYNPATRSNEVDGVPYSGTIFPTTVGTEEQRRVSLVSTANQSISDIRKDLTPSVLSELKAIRFTPGKVYSQLASPEAKRLYVNLRRSMENEVYLRTGATANEQELENSVISNLAALNDSPADFLNRVGLLERSINGFSVRSGGGLPNLQSPQLPGLPTKVDQLLNKHR